MIICYPPHTVNFRTLVQRIVNVHLKTFCISTISRENINSNVEIMKVLNVAEKNDAAKNISSHLSRGNCRKREGLSVYNKIYDFNVRLWDKNCEMSMTSVSGHLLNHAFVGAYRNWHGCNPLSLFDAPIVKQCIEDSGLKIKKTLEREVRNCHALIIWTDCDREGENIGFEIIQVCQAIKPNINIYRAKFSEITQASVDRALRTLGPPKKLVSDAVDVRSELDLRIGAAFTRFQTMRLQKVFPQSLADMLISYGSCQFPTLGFVVERFLAIERFKSEPYWKIKVMDTRNEVSVEFKWERVRLFEELPCQVFLDICQEQPDATVEKVISKPKSKWRPLPLDTVELEKQGSRKLRLNAKEMMKIAEKLYTQGFISYPRTETNIFPKELNLVPLVEQQVANPTWGQFAQQVLTDGIMPRQGKKSDQAHPPIHPTKYADALQGNEARVYEFIVRHFLACISKNAEGFETIVHIDIAGEKFVANGLQIIAKNYLEVYIYEKWTDKEIHLYQQGQVFRPTSIEMANGETSPPDLLTEADLITLMDKHGIGTDATHAEHIDKIKSRHYVGLRDNQHLIPGKLGIGLVMGYDTMGFQMSKPNLRAELENDLKLICEGRKNPQEVLQNQISKYREIFKITIERANLIDNSLAKYLDERPLGVEDAEMIIPREDIVIFKCPKCGSNMVLKDRRQGTGKYIGCMSYPTCSNSIWFPQTVEEVEVLEEICSQCPGNMRKLKLKLKNGAFPLFGTTYTTCIGGCDTMFNEMLGIRDDNVRRLTETDDTGYGSMTASSMTSGSVRNFSSSQRTNIRPLQSSNISTGVSQRSDPRDRSTCNTNYSAGTARNKNSRHNDSAMQNRVTPIEGRNDRENNVGWTNSGASNITEIGRSNTSRSSSDNNRNKTWGHVDSDDVLMCNCHERAIQLTVRKEGLNQGRLFYKCAKPQGTGCDFFLWASDNINLTTDINSRDSAQSSSGFISPNVDQRNQTVRTNEENRVNFRDTSVDKRNVGRSATTNDDVNCVCGQPARKLTVQKEGPNKGRQFYGCPQGMQSTCNFFKWADQINDRAGSSNSSSTEWRSNERGRRSEAPKKKRATGGKRKCGICGVEGHTRKTCPVNAMDL